MTRQEMIAALKARCSFCKHFPTCVNEKPECFKATEAAIRSLEAWGNINDYIFSVMNKYDAPCSIDREVSNILSDIIWKINEYLKEVENDELS